MADTLNRTVRSRVEKTSDIEIHVSDIETDAGLFVEIREYVKSLDQYGRGLTFPYDGDNLDDLIGGLLDIRRGSGGTTDG